jgi:hypothetical protein
MERDRVSDPDPMSLFEVERKMDDIAVLLRDNAGRMAAAADRRSRAQAAYDKAHALAYLGQTEGTIPERKAHAHLACEAEYLELIVAKGEVMAVRSEQTNLLAAQEMYRSINVNVRDRAWNPRGTGG